MVQSDIKFSVTVPDKKRKNIIENVLVSVIIPNYNHAEYLDERIQSVLKQSFQKFELIILDDHSTDNSFEIINKYKEDKHISHIIINERNSGSPFSQWRRGIELAQGEWIWIAESDDSCDYSLLQNLYCNAIKTDNCSYSFCRSFIVDKYGTRIHEAQASFGSDKTFVGKQFIKDFLNRQNIVYNMSSVLFKKEKALSISPEYVNYKAVGDWLFLIEMAELGNISIVDNIHNFFRKHEINVTKKATENGIEHIEDRRIYDYLRNKGLISFMDSVKIRREKSYLIKYVYSYANESIRRKVLKIWDDSFYIHILLITSRLKNKLF